MKNNEKGFGVLGLLLIILTILLIGVAGWYVWNRQQKDDTASKTASSTAGEKATESGAAEKDPTTDWIAYSNASGDFSFKHPSAWVRASNLDLCSPELILLAGNASSVGTCASEHFGQMGVHSTVGDARANYQIAAGYEDVTETAVTVRGVTGTKQTATAMGQDGEGSGALPDGTKVVQYAFFTKGRTYVATYFQQPSYPDVLSDFNLLVTKTLRFSK